jgi:flagellar biosynthesis protein FlhF
MSMLVKKFEAETMAAALSQVKETLGAEALILSTRTIGRKGLGVLGKQMIEITAAIESPATRASAPRKTQQTQQVSRAGKIPEAYTQRFDHLEDEKVTLSRQPRSERVEVAGLPLEDEVKELRARLEAQNFEQLQAELSELKNLMHQLTRQAQLQPAPPIVAPAVEHSQSVNNPLLDSADLQQMLVESGIDAEAALTIARFTVPKMSVEQLRDSHECRRLLQSTLASLVQASGPLWQQGQPQKRVSLVGATGVGKTTTIAKLAADALQNGARVALVTIDTFRIAAVEQLKVYGEIMGLPVEVVISPQQLQQAFARHQDKDLILIDTAGRSPQDDPRIEELTTFLGEGSDVENCLVLAAPTAERLQNKTLKAFSVLPLTRLIMTKLDESDQCGSMINLSTSSNLPLAYLTNGQRVPEDLLMAAPDVVAELVMDNKNEERRLAV